LKGSYGQPPDVGQVFEVLSDRGDIRPYTPVVFYLSIGYFRCCGDEVWPRAVFLSQSFVKKDIAALSRLL
jgi:hypothetical protein